MEYFKGKNIIPKRGDIYYISNSKFYATDPINEAGRPGIIVSSDKLNSHADMVEVVYLTTKDKHPMPTHTSIVCKIPSTALCETIYTVSKDRLGDFVRCCTDKEMAEIEKCMLYSLGIEKKSVIKEAPVTVDDSVAIERNLYKSLYESLLNKVVCGG